MEELEQPIIDIIGSGTYRDFMYRHRTESLGNSFQMIKDGHVVFPIQQTVRMAWNRLCTRKPKFCGGLHEHPDFSNGVLGCKSNDSPCCGHLEVTELFHTLGVGGFLAYSINPTIPHPGKIIEKTVQDDDAFQAGYGVSMEAGYSFNPIPVSKVPTVRRQLQFRQMETYYTIMRPYILRVGGILRRR